MGTRVQETKQEVTEVVSQLPVAEKPTRVLTVAEKPPRVCWFNPSQLWQYSFVEIDYEIFSTVILSLQLVQEGQLSVSGKRMINHLED